MRNLAEKILPAGPALVEAVVAAAGREYLLEAPGSAFPARRAAGCLLAPEAGDLVLVSRGARGAWILSVLERAGTGPARLEMAGDVDLVARDGRLGLLARDGLSLESLEGVSLTAPQVSVDAQEARVAAEALMATGGEWRARLGVFRLAARTLETVAETLVQKLGNSFRRVEHLDRTEAAVISQEAEDLYSARGRYSQVTAEKDLRLDGELMRLG
ncbi:MAG: DUF3540 domain-containing protein [Deltaproteobacteria bacterium]|nr:DUF3540 domain-containing protein [Deltaproteobacteria bacterium]